MSQLRVTGLGASLGGRSVLEGVDLEVEAGELVGLIGPNGAGKTTLIARTPHFRAVEEALSLVGMRDLAKRPIGELSGGQRQRVLVARALAIRPAVLLLDEPFTGLDMPTQEMLMDLFRALADGGRALLMTTHDLIGARAGCDRLYLLRRTIVASGRPDELADADPWIRAFDVRPDNPILDALGVRA